MPPLPKEAQARAFPESRIPNPDSRIPNPESRIPNPESRGHAPSSRSSAIAAAGLRSLAALMK